MIKIFMLASGRSGTTYLSHLFKNNINNCISKHEPTPDMFGESIYWYQEGEIKKIRKLFNKKRKKIERYNKDVYVEMNHAFLKSFSDVAMEAFPDIKLIHLIRNPLKVVRSQYNKGVTVGGPCPKIPYRHFRTGTYKGMDGKYYCRWGLTEKEKIFQEFDFELTRYQKLLTQWIEIENRAMRFLDQYNKHDDCYTLGLEDLNNENKIKDMFRFFGLKLKQTNIVFQGKKNITKTPTIVTSADAKQLQKLIAEIPNQYLKIFQESPYIQFEWANMLTKNYKK